METEFPFKTEESQDNGIRLGGAWRNFSERIQVLEAEKAALTEQLGNITEDRDSLLVERKDMQIRFHDSVSSLTEEFSGHMRSLQIIETIRNEKISISEKAERYESICEKLTTDLRLACDEINVLKQECYGWKSRAAASEALLEEEKVESVALRDMMYKKDVQIESHLERISNQEGDLDTMRRAMATKDRQLVLLVKERDRYKNDLKIVTRKRGSMGKDSDNDLSMPQSIFSSFSQSPTSPVSPKKRGSIGIAMSPETRTYSPGSPLSVDIGVEVSMNSPVSKTVGSSEREYKAIIRKLRADLDAANAKLSTQNKRRPFPVL